MSEPTNAADSARGDDLLRLLYTRRPVLSALVDRPQDKRELVESASVSRSTVDRSIRELEATGLVKRAEGAYVVTGSGRHLFSAFEKFSACADTVSEGQPLLDALSTDEWLPSAVLDGAEILFGESPARSSLIERWIDVIERADRLRALVPSVAYARPRRVIYEHVVSGSLVYLPVYATEVARFLANEWYEERREMVLSGNYRPREGIVPSYSVFLLDGPAESRMAISTYDGDGRFVGGLLNDEDDAIEWAEGCFERCRAEATPIDDAFRGDL